MTSASSFIPQTRSSSNLTAIQVGLINTLVASILSIILSTILGVIVGVMRISNNYLVNRAAWLYIEIFRNVPLLLIIIASYAVIIYNLPDVNQAIVLPGPSYLSNRGLYIPLPQTTATTTAYLVLLAVFLGIAIVMARVLMRRYRLDSFIGTLIALAILLVLGVAAWFAFPVPPFVLDVPEKTGLNFTGGLSFPPEFVGIVIGLTLGSAPFTADTVRAGLQSVTTEQIRAAHALGLNGYLTLAPGHLPPGHAGDRPAHDQQLPEPDQEFVAGVGHRLPRGRAHLQHHHEPDGPRHRDDGLAHGDLLDA